MAAVSKKTMDLTAPAQSESAIRQGEAHLRQLSAFSVSGKELMDDTVSCSLIPRNFVMALLAPMLKIVPIDDQWYREQNPDFYASELKGHFTGPRDHFVRFGYFENRQPYPVTVDPEFYIRMYPDIEELSRNEGFSAQGHFERYGYKEGRLPYEQWNLLTGYRPL